MRLQLTPTLSNLNRRLQPGCTQNPQTMNEPKKSPALLALTATALGLPGISGTAHGAEARDPTRPSVDWQTTYYQESSIDGEVGLGSRDRYKIIANEFQLLFPLDEQARLGVSLLHEKMSGASPWYLEPPADLDGDGIRDGDPVQIMSGATISDTRLDVGLNLELVRDRSVISLSTGLSDEDDYRAFNGGFELEAELKDRLTTISGGAGFSFDQVEPTDGGTPAFASRIERDDKRSLTFFAGVSRVLTGDSVIQTSLSVQQSNGFLSDPYKQVRVVDTGLLADSRPDSRTQYAWSTRYRRYITKRKAALHLDYRYFQDTNGIASHTLESAWHQNLKNNWRVAPSARYYTQSAADFYAPFFETAREDGNYTSDFRQSEYSAVALRVDFTRPIKKWDFSFGLQHYLSFSGDNPGLVDFTMVNLNFGRNF